jgi:hypothetical protein
MTTDIKQSALLTPGGHVRLGGVPAQLVDSLGVLSNLVGTWVGSHGWNLIAVPTVVNGEPNFQLLVRPFIETVTFSPVGALVPNRGGVATQLVPALSYDLRIFDAETNQPLHIENGMWLLLTDIEETPQLAPPESLARLAAIPHGTSVLALGNYQTAPGGPKIPPNSALPHPTAGALPGYTDAYLIGDGPFQPTNPNQTLQDFVTAQEANKQTIVETTTITISTEWDGGIANIPFVKQYANATRFVATLWIEQVQDETTGDVFEQLQYSQETDLLFHPQFEDPAKLITWPHTNVNTLVKQ